MFYPNFVILFSVKIEPENFARHVPKQPISTKSFERSKTSSPTYWKKGIKNSVKE